MEASPAREVEKEEREKEAREVVCEETVEHQETVVEVVLSASEREEEGRRSPRVAGLVDPARLRHGSMSFDSLLCTRDVWRVRKGVCRSCD